MEKTAYLPSTAVGLEALMAKWESVITALVTLARSQRLLLESSGCF